ncbi:hypothetical protein [Maricaulis maris]|nr:hypothetical protein [Maricaulis maris]
MMIAFGRAVLAICFCSLASACASAPISIAGSSFSAPGAPGSDVHRRLDEAVDHFNDDLEMRGLIREASSMQQAMRWMNQLSGQSDVDEPDALTVYLDTQAITLSDAGAPDRVRADVIHVWQGAVGIDAASRTLLEATIGLSRGDVTDALGSVEQAMANALTAQSVFETVILEMTSLHDADALAGLRVERDLLALRVNDLRDRADELAELRRQMRNPSIS